MGQGLENDRRVQPPQPRAAQFGVDDDGGEAKLGGLAHGLDGKDLGLVPMCRVRSKFGRREGSGGVFDGALVVVEGKVHPPRFS